MSRTFTFTPRKSALLVIDMQRYFLDRKSHACIPRTGQLLSRLKKLIGVFCKYKRPVIFTRHIDIPGSLMCDWWPDNIKEKDPYSEIIGDLDTRKGMIIVKNQYDAFFNTELEQILRQKKVEQLVISGVLTNLCCETTARSAFMRGFEVYFVADATATYKKQMHEASLLNLAYGFATITKVGNVVRFFP